MREFNIAICEDSRSIRLDLEAIVHKYYHSQEKMIAIQSFENGDDFIQAAMTSNFSVVFMDVDLGQNNGIEIIQTYRDVIKGIAHIIFVTSYEEYKSYVLPLHTFDYIVKPFKTNDIIKTLDQLTAWLENDKQLEEKKIVLKTTNGLISFNASNIIYCGVQMKKITIKTTTQDYYMYNSSLKDLIKQIDNEGFFSPHASYLINFSQIKKFTNSRTIVMANNEEIPIAQTKVGEFKEKYTKYLANLR